jgi:hypothetical protein
MGAMKDLQIEMHENLSRNADEIIKRAQKVKELYDLAVEQNWDQKVCSDLFDASGALDELIQSCGYKWRAFE